MSSLAQLFRDTVATHGERVAIHEAGRDATWAEVGARARAFSRRLLAAGLRPGDRVGIVLPNGLDYVASYFGTLLAGGCAVAQNPEGTAQELGATLGHCDARMLVLEARSVEKLAQVAWPALELAFCSELPADAPQAGFRWTELDAGAGPSPEAAWPDVPVSADDLAQIIYTSGTTGRPKGVTLSHRNLLANTRSIVAYLGLRPEDAVFVTLPFFYSYGNSLLLTHAAVGGRLVLARDFVFWNRALDLMEAQRATGFAGVPSSFAMLLHRSDFAKRRFPDLRYLTCAGGALPVATLRTLREALPHVQLFAMYGQTEAAARLSALLPDEIDAHPGSAGRAIPGVELSIRDAEGRALPPGAVGEVVARGENVMQGYWNDPEATRAVLRPEGLYTGDLGRMDEQGFLTIVGRRSDILKVGAYRVSPQELEEVLAAHPAVAEVAVAGRDDEVMGEVPVAWAVLREACPAEELLAWARERLPRHKAVREVHVVDALPRTHTGKLRRAALRETLRRAS